MHAAKTIIAVLLLLALTGAAVHRNARWHTLLAMWTDCAHKSPNKSRTRNNLGNCYLLLGRHFPALAEYRRAVAIDPGNLEAQYNLATTLDAVGLFPQAVVPYDVFCRLAPPALAEHRAKACARLEELLTRAGSGGGKGVLR